MRNIILKKKGKKYKYMQYVHVYVCMYMYTFRMDIEPVYRLEFDFLPTSPFYTAGCQYKKAGMMWCTGMQERVQDTNVCFLQISSHKGCGCVSWSNNAAGGGRHHRWIWNAKRHLERCELCHSLWRSEQANKSRG